MAVERYGSKTDVVVKLILVFFISLLSFTVGTYVGKKFSDNQHKISQLEPQDGNSNRDLASLPPEGNDKPKDALNDEEIKKLAEEFVADDNGKKPAAGEKVEGKKSDTLDKKEDAKAVAPTHAEAAVNEKIAANAPSEAAKRVVAGQTPDSTSEAPAKEKSRIPQSLPKELATSAIGKFTVQLAAFPTEPEAQKLASDLKDKGFSAFYVSANVKDKKTKMDKVWYRVSVGLFSTMKEADAYKNDLMARAKVSSALVTKITN